jgi:Flp pilus assembly pilin Flp
MNSSIVKRFWQDEAGAEMVEWAMVTLVLLVFTVGAILALRGELVKLYQTVFEAIQKDPPDTY